MEHFLEHIYYASVSARLRNIHVCLSKRNIYIYIYIPIKKKKIKKKKKIYIYIYILSKKEKKYIYVQRNMSFKIINVIILNITLSF